MLVLLFCVALVALVLSLGLRKIFPSSKYSLCLEAHDFFTVISVLSGIVAILLLLPICWLSVDVFTANTIDSKIAMYQEENAKIEQDVDKIVKEYIEHEHDIFADLNTEESSITLISLFPELKSDMLVQQQLEIYVSNNSEIKKLKEEKIDIVKKKRILYFGK